MSSTAEKQRISFASIKNSFPYPDFLEVQLKSFQDFLQLDTPPEKRKKEGLYKVFAENFPIADYNGIEIKTSLKYNSRLNLKSIERQNMVSYILTLQRIKITISLEKAEI